MQLSLFCDYRFHLKTSSFYVKYDALFSALEAAWAKVPRRKRAGRIGYGELAFIKAPVYKHARAIRSIPELLRDLESRPVLCEMIGFTPGSLPDSSRFYAFLAQTNNSKLENIHHPAVKFLLDAKVITLDILIADSRPVMANTRHNNQKNPNRSLDKTKKIKRNPKVTPGYYSYLKQPTGGEKKFSFFRGYRTHVLVAEGIPLVEITKPNNIDDATVARMLLRKLRRVYGRKKGRGLRQALALRFHRRGNESAAIHSDQPPLQGTARTFRRKRTSGLFGRAGNEVCRNFTERRPEAKEVPLPDQSGGAKGKSFPDGFLPDRP